VLQLTYMSGEESESNWEKPIDPFTDERASFISYTEAGLSLEEVARLGSRGLDVCCYRMTGDPEEQIRMNFLIVPGSIAQKVSNALVKGEIGIDESMRFVNDARHIESDDSFSIYWSDFTNR